MGLFERLINQTIERAERGFKLSNVPRKEAV